MNKTLLLYSTVEGQTLAIMEKIAEQLAQQAPSVSYDLYDIEQANAVDLTNYATVLIGGSIRYGHFRKSLRNFVQEHAQLLNTKKTAFFCVCVTARKPGKDTPEGSIYVRKFFQKTPWQPNLKGVFAGALYYPKYGWFDRTMIRFIMRMGGEKNHDMSQNYSYTNWDRVDEFAKQFCELAKA